MQCTRVPVGRLPRRPLPQRRQVPRAHRLGKLAGAGIAELQHLLPRDREVVREEG